MSLTQTLPVLSPRGSVVSAAVSVVGKQPLEKTAAESTVVWRRPTQVQGRALEILGHAIEYLVDSRLAGFVDSGLDSALGEEAAAVRLLSEASWAIFGTCPEVEPVGERIRRGLAGRLLGSAG